MIGRRGLGALAAALALHGPARAAGRIRIGTPKSGALALLRARPELHRLDAAWTEFTSGPPLLEAMNAGSLDFGSTGDTPPIFAQAAGADLLYVGAQPVAGANHAILVADSSPIRTLADLRGKRIAFTKGSVVHSLVIKALAQAGLTLADVRPVNLLPADGAAAFRGGAVDAWAIWDPQFAIAEQDPAVRVLTTAAGIAPTSFFFLATRAFAERSPDGISALLGAINDAAAWAAANPEALAQTLHAVTGVPLPAQRVAALRAEYAVVPMDDAVVAQQQALADSFADLRIIPSRINVRAAVWRPAKGA